jgi:hypothetical protein
MKRGISTGFTERKRITKKYYKQLYVNKLNKLEKMDKFVETPLKLIQKERESLNRFNNK